MKRFLSRIWIYLDFYAKADTIYRIHPPFLYHLLRKTFDRTRIFYDFDLLWQIRDKLKRSHEKIPDSSFSIRHGQHHLSLAQFSKKALHPPEDLHQLYRLVQFLKPQRILELGAGPGLSSSCLALANAVGMVSSIDGNPYFGKISNEIFRDFQIKNAQFIVAEFDSYFSHSADQSFDFVMLDGDHRYEAVLKNLKMIRDRIQERSCVVVDDIHWSSGMYRAWKELRETSGASCTLETTRWGILFFNPNLTPGHYIWIPQFWKPWQKYI